MADFIPKKNTPSQGTYNQPQDLAPLLNHIHPLTSEIKTNISCKVCGLKKNELSYSCRNCTFFVCQSCCYLIIYGTKLMVHEHQLSAMNTCPPCKICNKKYIDRITLRCAATGCKFDICPYCYIAEFQNYNRGRIT